MLKLHKTARRAIAVTAAAVAFAGSTVITAGTAHADGDPCYFRTAVDVAGVTLKPGICTSGSASSVWMVGGSSQTPGNADVVFTMNRVVNGQAVPVFYVHEGSCTQPSGCSYTAWHGAVQPNNYYNVSMSWIDGSGVWHGNIQSPTRWLS
ncbi:hypothetical protein [Streptomyces sp. NPDC040750]|uniref:hypothetical protein n=1 Tax=Streptomyces sp. NPDC040750 TaxID=3154491 RepID=UPI00340FB04D